MKNKKHVIAIILLISLHIGALAFALNIMPEGFGNMPLSVKAKESFASRDLRNEDVSGAADFNETVIPVMASRDVTLIDRDIEISEDIEAQANIMRYNERDVQLLAKLIKAEAGGIKSQDEKAAVGLTVLYRTQAKGFPDTVSGNIYKAYQYTEPAESYTDSTYAAAEEAFKLWSDEADTIKMPEKYKYFFGDGRRNYFYCYTSDGGVEFYEFPGRPNPANIYDLYRKIVLGQG